MKIYIEERFCHHCGEYHFHKCRDSGHERDSSGDWAECTIYHWVYSGYTGKYEPPIGECYED
jgi:hypothetical protein